jgi:hypothetical protein
VVELLCVPLKVTLGEIDDKAVLDSVAVEEAETLFVLLAVPVLLMLLGGVIVAVKLGVAPLVCDAVPLYDVLADGVAVLTSVDVLDGDAVTLNVAVLEYVPVEEGETVGLAETE